jgi:cation transport protein ChaC
MIPNLENAAEDLWVFGYGSLMWRPGFDYCERVEARLTGAHRALCVYSFVHRGTPERPGLVLGLDRGGACAGIAFRVAAADRGQTIAYLRAREQATGVYRECVRRIWLKGAPDAQIGARACAQIGVQAGTQVPALCYVVDRSHVQYAGRLPLAKQLHYIRQGHGQSGPNRDYVIATVAAMEALGMRESELHLLAQRLQGTHEAEAS